MIHIRSFGISLILCFVLSPLLAAFAPVAIWVTSQTDAAYYRNMADLYRKKVDSSFQADIRAYGFAEMPDKLAIAMKSGVNPPDIVQLDEIFFSLYLSNSRDTPFLDLTSRISNAGLDKAILSQRMGLFKYEGKTYGLPQSVSAIVLYYREDILKKLGVNPKDLDTWDKFIEVGRRIKSDSMSLLALDWSYFEILMRQRGFDIYDAKGNPMLTTPQARETLQWLVDLRKQGIGRHPDRGNIFEPAFFAGDVANEEVFMIMGADWYGLDMIQNFVPEMKGKWKAMPLPAWTDSLSLSKSRTSSFSGEGLLIYKKSKQIDRSWKFIRYVMEDRDANVERYLQGNCFTAYKPAWMDSRFMKPEPFFGGQSLPALFVELSSQIPVAAASPFKAQLVNLWREKYWSAVMMDEIAPEKALEEIQKELTRKQR